MGTKTLEGICQAYEGKAHWIFACDDDGQELLEEIGRRYYNFAAPGDFLVMHASGLTFAAAAKRRMQPFRLESLLRQLAPALRMPARELAARDVLVIGRPGHLEAVAQRAAGLIEGAASV